MLAKLHGDPFDDPDWLFEIKWDGYCAIAEVNKQQTRLYSRSGLSFEANYPSIIEALLDLDINAVLDGEIVALDEKGQPSVQLLQHAGSNDVPLVYYEFDLLEMNGRKLYDQPLIERKELLKKLLPKNDLIIYCDHIEEQGKDFFKAVGKQYMEGVIARKKDSEYMIGSRTPYWLKIKHVHLLKSYSLKYSLIV